MTDLRITSGDGKTITVVKRIGLLYTGYAISATTEHNIAQRTASTRAVSDDRGISVEADDLCASFASSAFTVYVHLFASHAEAFGVYAAPDKDGAPVSYSIDSSLNGRIRRARHNHVAGTGVAGLDRRPGVRSRSA